MINNNEVIDSNDGIIKQIKMVPTNKIDLLIKLTIINKIVTNEEKILNLRDVLPDNYILEEQLNVFKDRIKQKYELEL